MMGDHECAAPGLTADWLNAWLAAIGVIVLVPQARLSWSADPRPIACFHAPEGQDLVAEVAQALPDVDALRRLAIARILPGHIEFPRTVSVAAYADRARVAREENDFSLGATVTDLQDPVRQGGLPHGPFDPPVPQGRTLHQRLLDCRLALEDDPAARLAQSLAGTARRIPANGLGFDCRRFASGIQPQAPKTVDPVVECLVFFGLALLPVRGNGSRQQTRGWQRGATQAGAFCWPAWFAPLDRWAIDALLDQVPAAKSQPRLARLLGISALFETVPYQPVGSADTTRAYGSRLVS
jgi:hypothetical protein